MEKTSLASIIGGMAAQGMEMMNALAERHHAEQEQLLGELMRQQAWNRQLCDVNQRICEQVSWLRQQRDELLEACRGAAAYYPAEQGGPAFMADMHAAIAKAGG